ncbi:hypothetical protein EIN_228660 [Entamoeba invadens IP1]|uniref:TLDc domain-containing protein n=2 Tax=Entamoeba invadens TaxID=33085 RepID=A0A0A1U8S3_ENTIV|nr:hypothetical protein EIN_228660 [Entamoeba invadens IP1]ELP88383.1 hypothetical protein EIN_228660 [Entamoeba invadens IP1]BAN40823.1 hypothetical protein [Entamoeba invadens]|eukprot:XP_004255154.1 hypothetical protein EIN_228660 [Entamoeba invadens IP1]
MEFFVEQNEFKELREFCPKILNLLGTTERSVTSSVDDRFNTQTLQENTDDLTCLSILENNCLKLNAAITSKEKALSVGRIVVADIKNIVAKMERLVDKETADCQYLKRKINGIIDNIISKELTLFQKDLVPLQKAITERKTKFENRRNELLKKKFETEKTKIEEQIDASDNLSSLQSGLEFLQKWSNKKSGEIIFDSEVSAYKENEFKKKISVNEPIYVVCFDDKDNVFGCYASHGYSDTLQPPTGFLFSLQRNGVVFPQKFEGKTKGNGSFLFMNKDTEGVQFVKCGVKGGWTTSGGEFVITEDQAVCTKLSCVFDMEDTSLCDTQTTRLTRVVVLSFY